MNPTTVKNRLGDMKTIAQQLNVTEFPFIVRDKNGNLIYWEDSNGYWSKYEYDSNGNAIYYENSYGFWIKWEYDSDGNVIYSENSGGFWIKWEYDSDGNEIYFENSYGKIEDNRPKPCEGKVVEIDGIKYKLTAV
jgi:hypothetical protein